MMTGNSCGRGLALVRVGLGLYLLNSAWNKMAGGWMTSGEKLAGSVGRQAEQSEAFYQPFLQGTVLPNADLFARLIVFGEIGVGISLILGLFTALGALGGLFLMTNFILLKGLPALREGTDWLLWLGFLGMLIGSAGMTWGLDGRLFRRRAAASPVVEEPYRERRRDTRGDTRRLPVTSGR